MNSLNILVSVLLFINLSFGQSIDEWFGQRWLDQNYLFKWKTNHLGKVFTIRVEVQTKGWVSFGLSKYGKYTETDVVIGWVDDRGHSTFNDYWVNELGNRSLDVSQDWTLLSGEENATHTILEFSRHYVTCDESNDLEIYENVFEESNIIIAYNLIDPHNIESIDEPIVERVIHLNIFEIPENFNPKETDIEIVDHWLNLTLSPKSENSYCVLVKNEYTGISHQIIKYQVYSLNDDWKLNHHLVLLNCHTLSNWDHFIGQIFPCYTSKNNTLLSIRKNCSSALIINFLNNDPVIFPDNVGRKIEPVDSHYFLIEGHLKNSINKVVHARISLRIWLTKQLREFQTNYVGLIGTYGFYYNTWGFIVPPKQPRFKTSFSLSSYCFENDKFSETGIQIFKVLLHSHHGLYGELRHYRNDNLTRLLKHNYNDAGWQPFRSLNIPINLRVGDKLVVICDYNSLSDTKSYTSPHEHCAAIVYYYPAQPMDDEKTYSSRIPYNTMLKITGLEQIDGYDTEFYNNIIIRKPVKYNNTKLIDFISENKYKINDPKELEELQISEDMMECCHLGKITYTKTKPCRLINKPNGLYKSVMSNKKQNSCPSHQYLDKIKIKDNYQNKSDLFEKGMKLFVSFEALIN